MPKLPAYVFRRQNGSYRYKRNVPKKLRPLIGKDTLYRQLGESYSEAMNALHPSNRITQTDNANPSAEIAADWKTRLLKL